MDRGKSNHRVMQYGLHRRQFKLGAKNPPQKLAAMDCGSLLPTAGYPKCQPFPMTSSRDDCHLPINNTKFTLTLPSAQHLMPHRTSDALKLYHSRRCTTSTGHSVIRSSLTWRYSPGSASSMYSRWRISASGLSAPFVAWANCSASA